MNRALPLCIVLSYGVLVLQPDLRPAIPELVGVSATVTVLLALSLYFIDRGTVVWSPRFILILAAVLRFGFVLRAPELSDDLYRYLWDGLQLLAGNSPYALPPAAAPAVDGATGALRGLVNHPHLTTLYPPAAQLLFGLGALFGKSLLGMKLWLSLIDLGVCYLLLRLLQRWQLPPARAVLYAWHPLPVLEVAASGHIDGAGMGLFLLCLLLLAGRSDPAAVERPQITKSRAAAAGAAWAGGTLVKLLPLIYLPGCLRLAGRKGAGAFLAGAAVTATVLVLPFLGDIGNGLATLKLYAAHWEFSGFAFRALVALGLSGGASRLVLAAAFVLLATASFTSGGKSGTPAANLRFFYLGTLALLLLSPTLHPWYALPLAALLPLCPGAAGLVLCWSVFLAYRVLLPFSILGQWQESDPTAFAVAVAPLAAAGLLLFYRRINRANRPAGNG